MAKIRGQYGQFTQIGDEERKVRSLRLTDSTWEALGQIAEEKEATRADLVEELTATYYTESSDTQPSNTRELEKELEELRDRYERAEACLRETDGWKERLGELQRANAQNMAEVNEAKERASKAEARVKDLEEKLKAVEKERDEFDRECNQLHEKHGDAVHEIELLKEQPTSQPPTPAIELAELGVAVSKFNGKRPKAKIKLDDVREILKLMGVEV